MANYATLKAAIQNVVKTNGNNEITGALLQQSLLAMINSLGSEYLFVGIAQPATTPGTPDQNVFYIAGPGTYSNFDSFVVPDGYLGIMKYNGSWSNDTIAVGQNYDDIIEQLQREIYGEQHTYTENATGGMRTLNPPIIAGTQLVSLVGGPISLLLEDENGVRDIIQVSAFPYTTTKKYLRWSAYASGSPSTTLTTRYVGILDKISGNKTNIDELNVAVSTLQGDVSVLQTQIGAIIKTEQFDISDFVGGYTPTQSLNVGSTFVPVSSTTPVTPDSVAGQLVIPVKSGDNVIVKMRATSNQYCMAYVLLDTNYKILSWAGKTSQTFDWRTNPYTFNIENDGFLVLQFPKANYNDNLNAPLSVERSYIAISGGGDVETMEISLPSEINAIVGDTLQLYYRSIFRCVDFSKYDINVQCAIGAQYPRYYELTPLASQIGSYTLTFRIKDNNNTVIATKNTTLVVRAAGTSPAQNINVLCVGASGTLGGEWASELKRRLTGSGGTPAGSGLSNITFVGRKSVTKNGITVNLEATGGYRFSSYTNANTLSYRFNVANEPEINVGDVYAIGGHNYTITEINITTGQGGYFSCTGSGTPPASGTLTKVSGDGQDSVAYTSTSTSGNPFAYNGAINVQQYATDYCNGQIDVIYTELFGNGSSAYANDDQVNARMQEMQTFITQFRTAFPNVKFCIGLMWNPDVRGGMGVNYGASGGWSYAYGMKFTFMKYCNALQKYIDDNNLGDYVFICNWLNEFDEYNDFRQREKPVNVRSTVTEIFGENGVHPSDVGYNQLADAAYRIFISKFCQ